MEEIRKSDHKNYLPSYPFSIKEIIEKYILPNQKEIFKNFAEKIEHDAEKDAKRGRSFLEKQGLKAAASCKRISIISQEDEKQKGNTQLVEEIINMDYQSVSVFFEELSFFYDINTPLNQELITISEIFKSMRKVSEKHTNIINKELLNTLNTEL